MEQSKSLNENENINPEVKQKEQDSKKNETREITKSNKIRFFITIVIGVGIFVFSTLFIYWGNASSETRELIWKLGKGVGFALTVILVILLLFKAMTKISNESFNNFIDLPRENEALNFPRLMDFFSQQTIVSLVVLVYLKYMDSPVPLFGVIPDIFVTGAFLIFFSFCESFIIARFVYLFVSLDWSRYILACVCTVAAMVVVTYFSYLLAF